jgi:hypothetical protein
MDIAGGYTTSEAVRGVAGVDATEVPDQLITDRLLGEELLADLDEWLPTHAQVKSDGTTGSPTAEELKAWRNLRLYSTYYSGYLLLSGGDLAFLQQRSDGKSEVRRKSKLDIAATRDHLLGRAKKFREELVPDPLGTGTYVSRVSPDYDPVTHQ